MAFIFAVNLVTIVTTAAAEQKIGAPPEAMNMRLVGYDDLQGRSAYQPTIHHQGDRYIAYIGHHGGTPEVPKPLNGLTGQPEFSGTSIVDRHAHSRTDWRRPRGYALTRDVICLELR